MRDKLYLENKFACSFLNQHYVPKQCLRLRRIHFLLICCVSLPEHCRIETQFSLECAGKIILTNSVVLLSLLQYLPVHRMPFVQSHLHLCRLTTRNTRVLLDLQPQMQGINWLAATNKTFPCIFYSHPVRVQVILFFFRRAFYLCIIPALDPMKSCERNTAIALASRVTLDSVSYWDARQLNCSEPYCYLFLHVAFLVLEQTVLTETVNDVTRLPKQIKVKYESCR